MVCYKIYVRKINIYFLILEVNNIVNIMEGKSPFRSNRDNNEQKTKK